MDQEKDRANTFAACDVEYPRLPGKTKCVIFTCSIVVEFSTFQSMFTQHKTFMCYSFGKSCKGLATTALSPVIHSSQVTNLSAETCSYS